jgi:ZIP family zinc transporter
MSNLPELVVLAAVMGLSIFLSMPIVLAKSIRSRTVILLNAVAIGILIFLIADVFSNAAPIIYSNPSNAGYIAVPEYAVAFAFASVACFLSLYFAENRGPRTVTTPSKTALIIALAIGFQNLTEGLVFGANWAAAKVGLVSVIFAGFFIQNVSEGFPITAPLLGRDDRRLGLLTAFFLVGGLPTVLGSIVGYFYSNSLLLVVFDALAIGAILYVVLPMMRMAFRPADTPEASRMKQQLLYIGVITGFAIGFVTNLI